MATGPASLDELAERTGMPRGAIALLADALVTLGIVQKHDDQYSNGVVAAGFLSSSGPGDLRPWLRFFNRLAAPLS